MKTLPRLLTIIAALGCTALLHAAAPAADTRAFELRTYTVTPGNLDKLLARFRDHTMKIFEKHGMENIAYWVPAEAKDGAGEKLIYLIAHRSREAAKASWAAFSTDPEWKEAARASEVGGKIVAKAESLYLTATDFSPAIAASLGRGGPRSFELRTYTAPEGRLAALDARFRDHTRALFTKHGITNVAYFHPVDANKGAAVTLVYLIAHANREAAKASWAAFRADPVWVAAKAASETAAGGSLTVPDGVKSVFLTPTDFSQTK
ncbi:MAG: NIPSNAP family protein [Opitutus sp.]|nr:NIPSNAP family protein [Opitutus sp.]